MEVAGGNKCGRGRGGGKAGKGLMQREGGGVLRARPPLLEASAHVRRGTLDAARLCIQGCRDRGNRRDYSTRLTSPRWLQTGDARQVRTGIQPPGDPAGSEKP